MRNRRRDYYQYEPPVAMFSMAEIDKYYHYQSNYLASAEFGKKVKTSGGGYFVGNSSPKGAGKSAGQIIDAGVSGAKNLGAKAVRGVGSGIIGGARLAGRGVSGAARLAGRGAGAAAGLAGRGIGAAAGLAGRGIGAAAGLAGRGIGLAGKGAGYLAARPGLTGGLAIGAAAAGAGATMFLRRRKSKKGKLIVEQVRR